MMSSIASDHGRSEVLPGYVLDVVGPIGLIAWKGASGNSSPSKARLAPPRSARSHFNARRDATEPAAWLTVFPQATDFPSSISFEMKPDDGRSGGSRAMRTRSKHLISRSHCQSAVIAHQSAIMDRPAFACKILRVMRVLHS
jgi:hypothetical protein